MGKKRGGHWNAMDPIIFQICSQGWNSTGELKKGEYWNTNDIFIFQRFFGPICISKLY